MHDSWHLSFTTRFYQPYLICELLGKNLWQADLVNVYVGVWRDDSPVKHNKGFTYLFKSVFFLSNIIQTWLFADKSAANLLAFKHVIQRSVYRAHNQSPVYQTRFRWYKWSEFYDENCFFEAKKIYLAAWLTLLPIIFILNMPWSQKWNN